MKPTSLTAGVLSAIAAAFLIVSWFPRLSLPMLLIRKKLGAQKLHKLASDGNYKDAYDGFRKLALDPKDDPLAVGGDLDMALQARRQLGRLDEIDELRENVAQVHAKNWRLLIGRGRKLPALRSLRLHRRRQVFARARIAARETRSTQSNATACERCSSWPRRSRWFGKRTAKKPRPPISG